MNIIQTPIKDLLIIENKKFGDDRGWFAEAFRLNEFQQYQSNLNFVQCNESFSSKNILRGIHFQNPNSQGKLVKVVRGEVFDVAVDLRVNSQTFGKWFGITLSQDNNTQLWVPPGFGHGFYVTGECAHFIYSCTDYYNKDAEHCLKFDDAKVNIQWPITDYSKVILSEKDAKGLSLDELLDKKVLF